MSSFDDESVLFDPNSLGEKKHHKYKGLSPRRIRGILEGGGKKLKSGKKEKKEKKEQASSRDREAFTRFTSGELKDGEKSAEWASFQQMQERIRSTVLMTQAKVSRLETGFEDELEKLASSAQRSPWSRDEADGAPPTTTADATTAGWEGFDDDFAATPNIELSSELSHLSLTPISSPKPTPLPPHNSRRASVDEEDAAGAGAGAGVGGGTCEEADLLGLSAGTTPTGQAAAAPPSITDLLGDIQTADVPGLSMDFLSLSRNELGSAVSSGCSSPAERADGADQVALSASMVDEFLGIGTDEQPKTVTLQDPLQMLELRMADKRSASPASGPDAFASSFGATHAESEAEATILDANPMPGITDICDDDDIFGLGLMKVSQTTKENTAADLFVFQDRDLGGETVVDDMNANVNLASPLSAEFDPRAEFSGSTRPLEDDHTDLWATPTVKSQNPFRQVHTDTTENALENPFTNIGSGGSGGGGVGGGGGSGGGGIPFIDDGEMHLMGTDGLTGMSSGNFDPFATITDEPPAQDSTDSFDPFQTIHDDDAFEVHFPEGNDDEEHLSPTRFNPFDKEPPLDEKFASFQPSGDATLEESSTIESSSFEEEETAPFEPYRAPFEKDGWQMMVRQPAKKKLTHNRFWKPVYVRLAEAKADGGGGSGPVVKVFRDESSNETLQELPLQSGYNLCNMGLQTYDQFGKCHTVKIQYVFYRERVGVKAERVAPTLSDLTRVRDLKGLRDLVHKPKATMILDHTPQASELLKFGSLNYADFCSFVWSLEDVLFRLPARQEKGTTSYNKDEITVDVVDEYAVEVDVDGHIVAHKARVRLFCLCFLSGAPMVEVGINDKRRQGREVVGRQDIIPIKTEQWIRVYEPQFHAAVDADEYERTRVIKLRPMDASQFEMMRFRVHPKVNKELPLQLQVRMSVVERHIEMRAEIIIPGYHSSSRKAAQMPCEDIQIRFPLPEEWIYLLRVEKRFRYGSLKSTTRKPGKIKGLERLSMIAQGILPPSLIEVSTGIAKYEHVYRCVVWRISQLPERNQGKQYNKVQHGVLYFKVVLELT